MRCVASWNSQLMQGDGWAEAGRKQWFVLHDGPIHTGPAAPWHIWGWRHSAAREAAA